MDDTSGRLGREDAAGPIAERTRGYAAGDRDEPADDRTKELRHEIEETRGEMTETIDAIQEKLKPRNIMANATERVKSAASERVREMADTASETAQQAMDYTRGQANSAVGVVRQNPIPLALMGVGAAWLLSNRSRRPAYSAGRERRDDYQRYGAAEWPGRPAEGTYAARGTDTGTSLRRMTRRGQNQLQRMIQDNPLLVGAGALMLGAAFGLAVPETEAENELMGEARDKVVGRARDMARDAASQVEEAAGSVADAAGKLTGKTQP